MNGSGQQKCLFDLSRCNADHNDQSTFEIFTSPPELPSSTSSWMNTILLLSRSQKLLSMRLSISLNTPLAPSTLCSWQNSLFISPLSSNLDIFFKFVFSWLLQKRIKGSASESELHTSKEVGCPSTNGETITECQQ